jgi:hypothetical protein
MSSPAGTAETCARLVREALREDFALISALAGTALLALEIESDFDLGVAFDRLTKVQLAAAESLESLVEAQSRP